MVTKTWLYSLVLVLVAAAVDAKPRSSEEWRTRSIYQIITDRFALKNGSLDQPCELGRRQYCGGSWAGIEDKLDYITGMGFDAIWISPVAHNVNGSTADGEPYHGYWPDDFYSLNQHFGDYDSLESLINACHDKDVWVMLDVVLNNEAAIGPPKSIDYSSMQPFNNKKYYNEFCWIDYSNETSTLDCWAGSESVPLPDLDDSREDVRNELASFLKWNGNHLNADGYRFDAVKSMPRSVFPDLVTAADAYCIGEMYTANVADSCAYQNNTMPGVLNFPLYYGMTYAFNGTGVNVMIEAIDNQRGNCSDTLLLGTFSENHDLPRFASVTSDQGRAMNMLAFLHIWDGIPILYYGAEQHFNGDEDPYNREALWTSDYDTTNPYYTLVKLCNAFRKLVMEQDDQWIDTQSTILDWNDWQVVFQRREVLSIMGNWGVDRAWNVTVDNSTFSEGEILVDIVQRENFTVGSNGGIGPVSIHDGQPRIFYPATKFDWDLTAANTTKIKTPDFTQTTTMTTDYFAPTYSQTHTVDGTSGGMSFRHETPWIVGPAVTAVFLCIVAGLFI